MSNQPRLPYLNVDTESRTPRAVGRLRFSVSSKRGNRHAGSIRSARDNKRVKNLESVSSTEALASRLAPLRDRLASHPLYTSICTLAHVRIFMESHVFAVWDFMSLLKSLQRTLTCVSVPWVPTRFPESRRFINEIVLGEESDVYNGRAVSHFEVYLEAMEQVQADTRAIRQVIATLEQEGGRLDLSRLPFAARNFVANTFDVIEHGSPAAQAAVFAFSREDAIPDMFRSLVRHLNEGLSGELDQFVWYLERHIEVDSEDHGPLSLKMVENLCGNQEALWEEAAQAAEHALRARLALWDGVLAEIEKAQS